ncbi:adenosylcobinamide-GDP ribazoletransferase [Streptomyces sp. NPDC004726]
MSDLAGVRFAFGTLTVFPVRVTRWDRDAARAGMVCAPLAGLVVGLVAGAVGGVLLLAGSGPLLAAVAGVAVPAVLTRALHLDGLADTADGLGSGKPAQDALRIMKRSDIGPFGVITLLFVLLAQVAAVSALFGRGWSYGALALAVSGVTARLALTLAARTGVPAARPDGLGAAVAESVPVRTGVLVAALVTAVCAGTGALLGTGLGSGSIPEAGWSSGAFGALHLAIAVLAGLAGAQLVLRHCVRRFGGVTGDVFGALAETAATVSLAALVLGPH